MGAKPIKSITTQQKATKTSKDVKVATSNLFVKISDIPVYANLEELVLQELNSGEILDYGDNKLFFGDGSSRTISGNALTTSIMQSASGISSQYNPLSILTTKNYKADYLSTIQYRLDFYKPTKGTGVNEEIVYLDEYNNLIINTDNVQDFQEVEIEFWSYSLEINDTIIE